MERNDAGRLPWYSNTGENIETYIIGIGGASASGKTTVSHRIISQLGPQVAIICLDSFYRPLNAEQIKAAYGNNYNFDHPDALDLDMAYEKLKELKLGKCVEIPNYDFSQHNRTSKTTTIYGVNVIIFEGIFALYDAKIRSLMDLKLFVDTDADVCLARRLKRDIVERGRDTIGVLTQYRRFVKPMFMQYVQPSMKFADIISPRGKDNVVAIDLITKHINRQLNERGILFRSTLNRKDLPAELPKQVVLLTQTNQLKCIQTIIRDKNTSRTSFVFHIERLSTMLVEFAMNLVPIDNIMIEASTSGFGKSLKDFICGICVIRGGSALESGLRQVVKDAPLGRILIQTDPNTGEPKVDYFNLATL
eukprot:NODE_40_length_35084_cov_0.543519.p11 type:complete len:363 gc:universal NODE_40_length_35084_cov_0.543519:34152-33064(-)